MVERARFAPSPTGPLHIGGVRTALFNYLIAKKSGGSFILRIEDTDSKRTVSGAEKHIIDSLKWLGLKFDEGPVKQSERKSLYTKSVASLIKKGLAYYAFDTADELDQARKNSGGDFKYNFTTRKSLANSFSLGEEETKRRVESGRFVVRMIVPEKKIINVVDQVRGSLNFNSEELEDKIILKSDGMPTYHLANVVDDNEMKITSVIRGEEWLSSLPSHVLLYEHFGWDPPKFYHLPLILKSSGAGKLSKRDAEEQGHPVFAVNWEDSKGFKEAGFSPEGLVNYLALLGWSNSSDREKYSLDELVQEFNDGDINKSGARFDFKKALWVNHLHMKSFSAEKLLSLSEESSLQLNEKYTPEKSIEIIDLVKERLNTSHDLGRELAVFLRQPKEYDLAVIEKIGRELAFDILNFCKLMESIMSNPKDLKEELMAFGSKNEISFGNIMKTLRLCLVGSLSGPDLFKIIEIIGPEETLHRIESLTNKI
ncbi:glutamate--tRNA ligase [Flavobacteriaceae bacterium]|nr:glutamate--tRNA ligase [Flavobacteriaceae bacterium]